MANEKSSLGPRVSVFAVTCWALALVAFCQLLIGGLALAARFEESKKTRIVTKVDTKTVVIRIPAAEDDTPKESPSFVSRPPIAQPASPEIALPAPTPIASPKIADPRSERLVTEARKARVRGDMGLAIVKLEDALTQSPDDPTIHFELGLVHEKMGLLDIASAHYEKVYQMGLPAAGALYEAAAKKIGEGFQQESALGKLSLSRVKVFPEPKTDEGQRVILTIPVEKAPGEELDLDQIGVQTLFFNRTTNGEIVQLADEEKSWVTDEWTTLPFDFANGEETVRVTYTIPPRDLQTERLFGERTYYGHVVSLLYKGEIVDVQASPPALAARIPQQNAPSALEDSGIQEMLDLPPDSDPNMLLPPLPPAE